MSCWSLVKCIYFVVGSGTTRVVTYQDIQSRPLLAFPFCSSDLRSMNKRDWVIKWAQVVWDYVPCPCRVVVFVVVVHCLCCMCVQMLSPSYLPALSFVCRLSPGLLSLALDYYKHDCFLLLIDPHTSDPCLKRLPTPLCSAFFSNPICLFVEIDSALVVHSIRRACGIFALFTSRRLSYAIQSCHDEKMERECGMSPAFCVLTLPFALPFTQPQHKSKSLCNHPSFFVLIAFWFVFQWLLWWPCETPFWVQFFFVVRILFSCLCCFDRLTVFLFGNYSTP